MIKNKIGRGIFVHNSELPDIDTDFEDPDAAKEMLAEMFGNHNVACVSTYATFSIKSLLKDVCRVFGLDHGEVNKSNKKIESEIQILYKGKDKNSHKITIEEIKKVSPTFRSLIDKYPEIDTHVGHLFGKNRQVGRHAAGVIIGDNLPEEMPVFVSRTGGKEVVQTSYTEGIVSRTIAEMGFVKFDILGLATLSVIRETLKQISTNRNISFEEIKKEIQIENLNLNDEKILEEVFHKGNTTGIFQFGSQGITNFTQRVKPDSFEDISAITSLYRPGPQGAKMDELFIENKRNPENIEYIHEDMREILQETRGCIVFQEQVLKIGNKIGKLSMVETDRLRKLFIKKDNSKKDYQSDEEKELNNKFLNGCINNGLAIEQANDLWEKLAFFSTYSFNSAHAKAYSAITMQTAYLRTYYPLEFFCALLKEGDAKELQDYVNDIKKQGFRILPVDINKSTTTHKIENNSIRLALTSPKGVGDKQAVKIEDKQPFNSFKDFLYKTKGQKTVTNALIKIGAFKSLDDNIAQLEKRFELWFENPKYKKEKNREEFEEKYEKIEKKEHPPTRLVDYENELMGFNLRGSPFDLFERMNKIKNIFGSKIPNYNDIINSKENIVVIPVILKNFSEKAQRNGGMMSFMKFEDVDRAIFEAPCFAGIWRFVRSKSKKNNVFLVTFNRKLEQPKSLLVGKPGFKHSQNSVDSSFINVDNIDL